jgi:hypothetical protein
MPLVLERLLASLYAPAVENPLGGHEPELPLPNTFNISSQLTVHLHASLNFLDMSSFFGHFNTEPKPHPILIGGRPCSHRSSPASIFDQFVAYDSHFQAALRTYVFNVRSVEHSPRINVYVLTVHCGVRLFA